MKPLSARQKAIYEYIVNFTKVNGYPPSVREIGEAVGLKSPSTVHAHLKYLHSAGYIQRDDRKTRAISLNGATKDPDEGKIPILGVVAAGEPILAEQNIDGYLNYSIGDDSSEYFSLRVRGDSMINAGIMPGDLVVIRVGKVARSGQIVVAMIDGEATVKRLLLTPGQVWLMPENPAYSPIDGNQCEILGVVTALVREY